MQTHNFSFKNANLRKVYKFRFPEFLVITLDYRM